MGCFISSKIELVDGGINDWFPPEVLGKIFLLFSLEEQLSVLSKVCTLWRDVVLDLCALRKYLYFSECVQELIKHNRNIFSSIQQLDVNITNHQVLPNLTILLASLRNLKILRVAFTLKGSNSSQLGWPKAKSCFTSLRCSIERLEVVDCCRLMDRISAGKLAVTLLIQVGRTSSHTLRYLHYRRIRVPEDNRDQILQLLANFQHLEVLNLSGCWLGTPANRLSSSCRALSQLKHLDIRRSHILTNSELISSIITSCPQLESLGISPNIVAHRSSICNLAGCDKLANILVDNCVVNQDNFDAVLKLLQVASLVKELKVGYFTEADMMWSLAQISIPTVEELDIYRSPNLITNELVAEFARHMPQLKRLIISRCRKLSNEGIHRIIGLLGNVQYINAGYNKNIDDKLVELLQDTERSSPLTINVYACALSDLGRADGDKHVYVGKCDNICIKWGL